MISKKELYTILDKRTEYLMMESDDPKERSIRLTEIKTFRDQINSLPDDQPDLLPFQWPIPDGMEVVTRDGRKVVKIDFWEMLDMPVLFAVDEYSEVFEALPDGKVCLSRQSDLDLFLRRKEKKVWVVEWPEGGIDVHKEFPAGSYPSEISIYEATLKPVV